MEELNHFSEEEISIKDEPTDSLIVEDFEMPASECDDQTSYIKSEPQSPIAAEYAKGLENTGPQEDESGELEMSNNQAYFLRSLTRNEVAEELNLAEPPESESKSQRKRVLEEDDFEQEVLNYLRANCGRNDSATQDPDEMFLLSQLPLIRKFSLADKADFQIKVIQLLQSYLQPSE